MELLRSASEDEGKLLKQNLPDAPDVLGDLTSVQ
jgi:hypothetical protein